MKRLDDLDILALQWFALMALILLAVVLVSAWRNRRKHMTQGRSYFAGPREYRGDHWKVSAGRDRT